MLSVDPVQLTYLFSYCFEVEAGQFDDVSQFEYGTQRGLLWIMKAFPDVRTIDTLHQVTPESTRGRYENQVILYTELCQCVKFCKH